MFTISSDAKQMIRLFVTCCAFLVLGSIATAQKSYKGKPEVVAYYAGSPTKVDSFAVEKLTHIIFSFCHLKGNELAVSNARDSLTIHKLVALKQRNPTLKVILSLGGWGGCATCSQVFATRKGRKAFAVSAKKLNDYFQTDGIDLDWEYPAIAGFPGHVFAADDKQHFTDLVKILRRKLGKRNEISFAAGGFTQYLTSSVDWKRVARKVDKINLMTYDLVGGYSQVTGHHTALYSTPDQTESVDHAVRFLDSVGVPKNKLFIGAAFYGRVFIVDTSINNGLYQRAHFDRGMSYANFNKDTLLSQSFTYYWDDKAKAPYLFSATRKEFISLDDDRSIMLKTRYVMENQLGGIMFWQLGDDKFTNGLLDVIDKTLH